MSKNQFSLAEPKLNKVQLNSLSSDLFQCYYTTQNQNNVKLNLVVENHNPAKISSDELQVSGGVGRHLTCDSWYF